MRKSLLFTTVLMVVGVLTPVYAQIDGHWGMQTLSHVDEHFDYWGRCTSNRYELERRLSYCKSVLADGRHRQVAVLTEMANAYFDSAKYADAATTYADALSHQDTLYVDKLDDYRRSASTMFEQALVLSGKFDAAMDHINLRIKDNPDAAFLYNQRCWLRAIAGRDLNLALADCNEALKRSPDDAATLDSRGLVNFKLGNMKEAEADYDVALVKNGQLASSLFVRGIAKSRTGDAEKGNEDIAAAKNLDSKIVERFADYGVKP